MHHNATVDVQHQQRWQDQEVQLLCMRLEVSAAKAFTLWQLRAEICRDQLHEVEFGASKSFRDLQCVYTSGQRCWQMLGVAGHASEVLHCQAFKQLSDACLLQQAQEEVMGTLLPTAAELRILLPKWT